MSFIAKCIVGIIVGTIIGWAILFTALHYHNYQNKKYREEKENRGR